MPDEPLPRSGIYVLGLATAAAGVLDLIWGEFERAHQPIQALGDHIPGQRLLAYLAALWLIAAGAALLRRRTARPGAAASAVIYGIFALFWLPRFYTAPRVLGYHAALYIGLSGGVATQLIVAAGAALVYAATARPSTWARTLRVARWVFGLAAVNFGLVHLTGTAGVAQMVPTWLPPGGSFWAVLTGVSFVLAGLAILSKILDLLAARLLALMLLVFSALALAPMVLAAPRDHVAWGANAYNLAAAASVWIFASAIAHRRPRPALEGEPARTSPEALQPLPHSSA